MKIFCYILLSFSVFGCHAQKMNERTTVLKDSIAEKILAYQLENGAWPKQLADKSVVDYTLPLDEALLKKIKETDIKQATIDNKATTREIQQLMEIYGVTKNKSYLDAAERGIAYLVSAQYDNGGFPQYFPSTSLYRGQITLNDNAMVNALTILDKAAKGVESFENIQPSLRQQARQAVEKGILCLLRLQVKVDGITTIWAAQYDEKSLTPAQARAFEPASLSTSESVNVVRFLMKQPPSDKIRNAIESAIQWFETHDIEGYRFDLIRDELSGKDRRRLIADSTSVIWARFYHLENHRPIFGDRDNSVTYNYDDLSLERQNGYAWFGTWPKKLLEQEYPKWIKRIEKNK